MGRHTYIRRAHCHTFGREWLQLVCPAPKSRLLARKRKVNALSCVRYGGHKAPCRLQGLEAGKLGGYIEVVPAVAVKVEPVRGRGAGQGAGLQSCICAHHVVGDWCFCRARCVAHLLPAPLVLSPMLPRWARSRAGMWMASCCPQTTSRPRCTAGWWTSLRAAWSADAGSRGLPRLERSIGCDRVEHGALAPALPLRHDETAQRKGGCLALGARLDCNVWEGADLAAWVLEGHICCWLCPQFCLLRGLAAC